MDQPPDVSNLRVKIFADGADLDSIRELAANPLIKGFTTNPTLMRKAGVTDYERFGRELLQLVPDRPISFEVFADDFGDMERQALKIASWGDNVYVKVPVTSISGESAVSLIRSLSDEGVKVNVTAMLTVAQVEQVVPALRGSAGGYVSVFAGRAADAGCDPVPIMQGALRAIEDLPDVELIWASPRELLNIVQAHWIGCDVITVTSDLLAKLGTIGRDLEEFSLATVRMFSDDARASGFAL